MALEIKCKKIESDAILPKYAHQGDAGMDLFAYRDVILGAKQASLVGTGIKFEIPYGYEGQIRPRSGLSRKHSITVLNSPGTIDAGYRGEIGVILMNHGNSSYHITAGDAIAQIVFAPILSVSLVETTDFSDSDRGEDGFGSTS